eukprot:gene36383-47364_t
MFAILCVRFPVQIASSVVFLQSISPKSYNRPKLAKQVHVISDDLREPLLQSSNGYYKTERRTENISFSPSENKEIEEEGRGEDDPSGRNYYSEIFFMWLNRVFPIAQARSIEVDDLVFLPFVCTCRKNADIFTSAWTVHGSLLRVVRVGYLAEYCWIGTLLGAASVLNFVGPLALRELVRAAEQRAPWDQILLSILLLFLSKVLSALFATHYSCQAGEISISISAAIKSK